MIIDFKKLREVEGITPDDIALTLGISQAYVSLLLNGKRKMSPKKWDLLKSKYCNIENYITDSCNNESNITEPCNISQTEENKIITAESCDITKGTTPDSNNSEEKLGDNNHVNVPVAEKPSEDLLMVPAFILRMRDDERKRFDAQMDHVLQQNDEMLRQNRILVETLRMQTRYLNDNISNQVADDSEKATYNKGVELSIKKSKK